MKCEHTLKNYTMGYKSNEKYRHQRQKATAQTHTHSLTNDPQSAFKMKQNIYFAHTHSHENSWKKTTHNNGEKNESAEEKKK